MLQIPRNLSLSLRISHGVSIIMSESNDNLKHEISKESIYCGWLDKINLHKKWQLVWHREKSSQVETICGYAVFYFPCIPRNFHTYCVCGPKQSYTDHIRPLLEKTNKFCPGWIEWFCPAKPGQSFVQDNGQKFWKIKIENVEAMSPSFSIYMSRSLVN